MHQILVPDLCLILVESLEYSQCIQETLMDRGYFERGLSKILKKNSLHFVLKHSLYGIGCDKRAWISLPVPFQLDNQV